MKIAWKIPALSLALAHIRYRTLTPMLYLKKLGHFVELYTANDAIDFSRGFDVLIFNKSFGPEDLRQAALAHSRGIPVILDICDNLAETTRYLEKRIPLPENPSLEVSTFDIFLKMSAFAQKVTVPTPALKEVLKKHIAIPIEVISDPVELSQDLESMQEILSTQKKTWFFGHGFLWIWLRGVPRLSLFSALKTRSFVKKFVDGLFSGLIQVFSAVWNLFFKSSIERKVFSKRFFEVEDLGPDTLPPAAAQEKTIVWFGNAGYASESGLRDLEEIRDPLESLAQERKVRLLIISNDFSAFTKTFKDWKLNCHYLRWNAFLIYEHLKTADLAIFPKGRHGFSQTKSPNRVLLALANGLPVIASSSPSYEGLETYVRFDNWAQNLKEALDRPKGPPQIPEAYKAESVARAWEAQIKSLQK